MNGKKLIAALLAAVFLMGAICGPAAAQPMDMESVLQAILAQGGTENEEMELPLYFFSADDVSTIRIMYMEGFDVPVVSVGDWTDLLNRVDGYLNGDEAADDPEGNLPETKKEGPQAAPEYKMEFSAQDSTAVITRKNGSTVTFDNKTGTVEFSDHYAFLQKTGNGSLFDLPEGRTSPDSRDKAAYLKKSSSSYLRKGDPVTIDLTAYKIKMYQDEEGFYVPLQTLGDLMLSPLGINVYDNGEAVFITRTDAFRGEEGLTSLGEAYYSAAPGGRSEDLAGYSYQELCLVMDLYYGLKEGHRIRDFDRLFADLKYQEPLKSNNPKIADEALYKLISFQLDDGISAYLASSPYSGSDVSFEETLGTGSAAKNKEAMTGHYQDAAAEAYPEGIPGYQEIGNTAFLTIDSFTGPVDMVDYYETAPEEDAGDTIGLLAYAFRRITREESPIEHVVMDLSLAEGGDLEAAAYAIAFFLGEVAVCMEDSLSGTFGCGIYEADLNLDGTFDEKDSLPESISLYCLISPVTAAEASLAASAFENSQLVTMLGRTSGGGTHAVQTLASAWGTSWQIAGNRKLSVMKNGAVCEIENGAEPDYPITVPAAYYDREALAGFINGLPFGGR